MDKIAGFVKKKENIFLAAISLILLANSYLLVIRKMKGISFLEFAADTRVLYFIFFLCAVIFLAGLYLFSGQLRPALWLKKGLLVFLPAETIFLFAIEKAVEMHWIFFMIADLYVAIGGLYLLVFLTQKLIVPEKSGQAELRKKTSLIGKIFGLPAAVRDWAKAQGWIALIVLAVVLGGNIGFGSYHIEKFAAVDEALWTYERVPRLWKNLGELDWKGTKVSDKPGLTVSAISGIGLLWENPKEHKIISYQGEVFNSAKNLEDLNLALRLPIFLFNALMLLVFYILMQKLLPGPAAAIAFIFIGLSPLLLGISTIINPDSLLWVFLPLSILCYLLYFKQRSLSFLVWAGIFLGLSLLTKYIANILYIFFFVLIFLEYILNREKYAGLSPYQYLKRALAEYFFVIIVSLLTFFVLLPATWVEISELLRATLLSQAFEKVWPLFVGIIAIIFVDALILKNRVVSFAVDYFSRHKKVILIVFNALFLASVIVTFLDTYSAMRLYDFEAILASPKSSYAANGFLGLMFANFYSLVFGIAPIALFGLMVMNIKNISQKSSDENSRYISTYLLLFILLYYIASTINHVSATVRYQIVIYPVALIIAGMGIGQLVAARVARRRMWEAGVYFAIIAASIFSLNAIRPFYFSYANDLLPREYVLNLKDMGDGSYEAAQYLNSLPNSEKLVVWSDKRGVCNFFAGRCLSSLDVASAVRIDYFVISSGRESRTTKIVGGRARSGKTNMIRLDNLYSLPEAEYKIEIGGRPNNYVKVINAESIRAE